MFCRTEMERDARILHNSIQCLCAYRIYRTYGDSVLRDTKISMHSALQYFPYLFCFACLEFLPVTDILTVFIFLTDANFPGRLWRVVPGVNQQNAAIFSATFCSTHQPLEVTFAGYDRKCLYVMCSLKSFFGFVVVYSKAWYYLSILSELKVETNFARLLDCLYLSFL